IHLSIEAGAFPNQEETIAVKPTHCQNLNGPVDLQEDVAVGDRGVMEIFVEFEFF
ncbi:hypothetical protein KUCAC02_031180, partial [Chaenocephalus aceratus]